MFGPNFPRRLVRTPLLVTYVITRSPSASSLSPIIMAAATQVCSPRRPKRSIHTCSSSSALFVGCWTFCAVDLLSPLSVCLCHFQKRGVLHILQKYVRFVFLDLSSIFFCQSSRLSWCFSQLCNRVLVCVHAYLAIFFVNILVQQQSTRGTIHVFMSMNIILFESRSHPPPQRLLIGL